MVPVVLQTQFNNRPPSSQAAIVEYATGYAAQKVSEPEDSTASSSNESIIFDDDTIVLTGNDNHVVAQGPPEWTASHETKFQRLAAAKAQNDLSLIGRVEFEKLQMIRRNLKNPRTGEEILLEYQQRMLTKTLVNALSEYIKFHGAPANNSRKTA